MTCSRDLEGGLKAEYRGTSYDLACMVGKVRLAHRHDQLRLVHPHHLEERRFPFDFSSPTSNFGVRELPEAQQKHNNSIATTRSADSARREELNEACKRRTLVMCLASKRPRSLAGRNTYDA